ncbi:unnamed protein product [Trichobilharzia regenti]|nr:unnamed protein product [Trichobilharzia regenti]
MTLYDTFLGTFIWRSKSTRLMLTSEYNVLAYIEHVYSRWSLSEIRAIFNRSFLHRKVALEIFVASRGELLQLVDYNKPKEFIFLNYPFVDSSVYNNIPG